MAPENTRGAPNGRGGEEKIRSAMGRRGDQRRNATGLLGAEERRQALEAQRLQLAGELGDLVELWVAAKRGHQPVEHDLQRGQRLRGELLGRRHLAGDELEE